MLALFLQWRISYQTLSGDVVIRVLSSVKTDILEGRLRLLEEMDILDQEGKDNIAPIIKGIDARLAILENIWDTSTSDPEVDDRLSAMFEKPPQISTPLEEDNLQSDDPVNKQSETTILVALSLLFLTAAIIPGYKGYAISMAEDSIGSTGDADFWYLIQSNIMAVLGNFVMVIPLLRTSWYSSAYSLMWTFFTLGLAFSIISIAVYPFFNTGWSSLIAFLGSISSASSVLVMTQASTRESFKPKMKKE